MVREPHHKSGKSSLICVSDKDYLTFSWQYSIYVVYCIVTGREIIKILNKQGWKIDRIKGSHHILVKDKKTVVVPVHGKKDIPPGTMNSIFKQAGLKWLNILQKLNTIEKISVIM